MRNLHFSPTGLEINVTARPGRGRHSRRFSPYRQIRFVITAGFLLASILVVGKSNCLAETVPLRVKGRHFVDPAGRVVILRGVNVGGNAKVPPFRTELGARELDRVASFGMNVIRLLFIWEAYEPSLGRYDDNYLESLREIAREAAARDIHVIVDIHQDGFSRYCSKGAGDGFPSWAVSRRGTPSRPDNSAACSNWPIRMFTDRTTHRSFHDFHANSGGVRSRFLAMIDRVATVFAETPGVIGYDLLNEPWGDERTELAPLYEEMGRIILARHPTAILFLEGHVTTNCGLGTKLPRPTHSSIAYAPHYYKPLALVMHGWRSGCFTMDLAFRSMTAQSRRWDRPLFVGEFGISAESRNAGPYVAAIHDRLDAELASGAQWNLTPGWHPLRKDGWNGEDFSITDAQGNTRANYKPRPYPRFTAGQPLRFEYREDECPRLGFLWSNSPGRGETEIALPDGLFPCGASIYVSDAKASVRYEPRRRVIVCRSDFEGLVALDVTASVRTDRR